jgi:hypothetical protein
MRTPIRENCPSIKERLLESRKISPESRIKLKSTMTMYKSIKRSLTPIKPLKLQNNESLKIFSKSKVLPSLAGEITKISVKEYGIGNDYAKALSSTVKDLPNLKELNIRSNRVTDEGIFSLLSNVNKSSMKVLDLSSNTIGLNSINSVVEIISDFNSGIEKLSLESTRLSYPFAVKVFSGLRTNHTIQELNLANNKLGSGAGYHLKEFLSQTTTLKRLDLHWNLIQGNEAVLLFQGLKENDTLAALDISWNSIGSSGEAIEALCSFLSSESQLEHLDLSHNRISAQAAEMMGKALENNHSLMGIHLEGNHGRVDHLGFVFPSTSMAVSPSLQKSARIIRTPKRVNDHNCWICNKYIDFSVIWDPASILWKKTLKAVFNAKSGKKKELVYLHLDIDNFEPFDMKNDENSECFLIKRAIPCNRQVKFFFSYRGHAQVSFDYPTETLSEPFVKTILTEEITVKALNYFLITQGELSCKPRYGPKAFMLESGEESSMVISEWSFEKSHFANYVWDSEVINT